MMSKQKIENLSYTDFTFQTYDKLRYADTDRQGHINNALFSTFLETGRVEFLYNPQQPLAADNASFVIANLNLQLIGEINWPGSVEIGTRVLKLGNSSLTLHQGLFQNNQCVATAETVIVQINDETHKAQILSKDCQQFLKHHLVHPQ